MNIIIGLEGIPGGIKSQTDNWNAALLESYDFYHNDVEPRRLRERGKFKNWLYTPSLSIEKAKIGVGINLLNPNKTTNSDQYMGRHFYKWKALWKFRSLNVSKSFK